MASQNPPPPPTDPQQYGIRPRGPPFPPQNLQPSMQNLSLGGGRPPWLAQPPPPPPPAPGPNQLPKLGPSPTPPAALHPTSGNALLAPPLQSNLVGRSNANAYPHPSGSVVAPPRGPLVGQIPNHYEGSHMSNGSNPPPLPSQSPAFPQGASAGMANVAAMPFRLSQPSPGVPTFSQRPVQPPAMNQMGYGGMPAPPSTTLQGHLSWPGVSAPRNYPPAFGAPPPVSLVLKSFFNL